MGDFITLITTEYYVSPSFLENPINQETRPRYPPQRLDLLELPSLGTFSSLSKLFLMILCECVD